MTDGVSEASPRVSIVLPTTGRSSLSTALNSVAAQTVPVEVVVVDDSVSGAGTDLTDEWLGRHDPRHHRWTLIRSGGSGLSGARNVGVARSGGDIVAFLDDDDVICPHHIARLLVPMRHGAQFVTASTAVVLQTNGPRVSVRPTGFGWPDLSSKLLVTNVVPPSSVAIERSRLVPFDTELRVQEDWDAWLRLLALGVEPVLSPHLTCGYVKDVTTATSSTVRAGLAAEALRPFVRGNVELLGRHAPAPAPEIQDLRRRWRAQLDAWLAELASGRTLHPEYYEAALGALFGPPVRRVCCETDLASLATPTTWAVSPS
jgi:hypothetical protein